MIVFSLCLIKRCIKALYLRKDAPSYRTKTRFSNTDTFFGTPDIWSKKLRFNHERKPIDFCHPQMLPPVDPDPLDGGIGTSLKAPEAPDDEIFSRDDEDDVGSLTESSELRRGHSTHGRN